MPGTQRTCVFPLCGVSLRCMCMCKEGVGEPGAGLQTDNRRRRFPGKPRTRVPTTQTTTWATARACLWQEAWTVHVFALFESVCVGRFVVGARLSKFDEKWAAATPPPPPKPTHKHIHHPNAPPPPPPPPCSPRQGNPGNGAPASGSRATANSTLPSSIMASKGFFSTTRCACCAHGWLQLQHQGLNPEGKNE